MQTRKTPNKDTFHTVWVSKNGLQTSFLIIRSNIEKRMTELWFLICFLERVGHFFGETIAFLEISLNF